MSHWYGFLIGVGVIVSAQASSWLGKRRGIPEKIVWDGLWWTFLGGLIGARLYHVADLWGEIYSLNPISALYVWNGGLGIIGGIIGGFIGLWLFKRFTIYDPSTSSGQVLRFMNLLDIAFFGLPIGQAIGRIGNFINQEVYGWPTKLPWGIYVRPENRLSEFREFDRFHPLFAYEALWNLFGFFTMLLSEKLYRSSAIAGATNSLLPRIRNSYTGFYLVWYGAGRYFLEFLRIPEFSWRIQEINMAQVFSIAMVIVGAMLLFRHDKHYALHSPHAR